MPSVNWDQPSTGLVTDAAPALRLRNDPGPCLVATTQDSPTAILGSFHYVSLVAQSPESVATLGINRVNTIAVAGASLMDPNLPPAQNVGGIGIGGLTDRLDAIGAAGVASGPRSTGVYGQAPLGVGVIGEGKSAGVRGNATTGTGVIGITTSGAAPDAGVFGVGTVLAAGIRGVAEGGPAVDAHATAGPAVQALADQNHGVFAQSDGKASSGVVGICNAAQGTGVAGFSSSGVAVSALSSSGNAVNATTTTGVAVTASSTSGIAVVAHSFATTAVDATTLGTKPAISAFAPVATAVKAGTLGGVAVDAFTIVNTAVSGQSAGGEARGVEGMIAMPSDLLCGGVCGTAIGQGAGVVGVGDVGALAGRFQGEVLVQGDLDVDVLDADQVLAGHVETGFLAAGFKLFVIDHPLDPKRRVLRHACVEAPEYKTFYDGIAKLDKRGCSRVKLPRWFAALNGELRYQLTPLREAAPGLHISEEFSPKTGGFAIAGGKPGLSVSWQVTGVRKDVAARAQPLEVEGVKPRKRTRLERPTAQDLARERKRVQTAAKNLQREIDVLKSRGKKRSAAATTKPPALRRAVKSPSMRSAVAAATQRGLKSASAIVQGFAKRKLR